MIIPSSVGVTSAPIAFRLSVTVSMRSVSLTFSSAASLMTVVPSATAAMTAMTGISSMSVGMMSPSIVVPWSLLVRTRISAIFSPPSVLSFNKVISPPMSSHTFRIPARVGLMPVFSIRISESGTMSPAAIKYAAEEISPGTVIFCPYRSVHGRMEAVAFVLPIS